MDKKISLHRSFKIMKVDVVREHDVGYIDLGNENFGKSVNGRKFHLLNNIGDILYGKSFHHENHAYVCLLCFSVRFTKIGAFSENKSNFVSD